MRFDSEGMFWHDVAITRSSARQDRPMPQIPETGWRPPTSFPNLSAARAISLDTETYDPNLLTHGPGWARGSGHIVGVSLAVEDGSAWYFPIRHETQRELNLDPEQTLRWLAHTLKTPVPKIGANLIYDLGWLRQEGVHVGGRFYDVQYAEALINSETPSVSLDALGQTHLGLGKETSTLYQWLADWFGGQPTDRQRRWIYKAPPSLVGPYAEADARLPLQIMERQWRQMHDRNVLQVYDLECRLIPLLLDMRWQGAPVDIPAAERYHAALGDEQKAIELRIRELAGRSINPHSSDEIASVFRDFGLEYPLTPTGKPSFTAPWLETQEHPIAELIVAWRQRDKLRSVFLESYILDSHVNGRIYCEFHPLKGDENGARSGRFSSSNPNLQNIPIRTEEGREIRRCFAATKKRWRKYDYSQIEYRLLAHHAVGQGAEEIRARYHADPNTDYHDATIDLIRGLTGIELDRRPAKTINFGLIYGMSKGELIRRLKLGQTEGRKLYDSYHHAVPFAKATMEAAAIEVQHKGYVETLFGRKSDFPYWGPRKFDPDAKALSFDEALAAYGMNIERAYTHKALNRKLQGGAADVMKKAMVDCYEAGIFEQTGTPLLTVHDELDFDDDHDDPNAPVWAEMVHIMQTGFPDIRVPIVVEEKMGPNWAEAD